jgi:hypothetical protein
VGGLGGLGEGALLTYELEAVGGGFDGLTAGAADTVRARETLEAFGEGGERGERGESGEGEGLEESLGEVVRALSTYFGPIFHLGSSSLNFSQYRIRSYLRASCS